MSTTRVKKKKAAQRFGMLSVHEIEAARCDLDRFRSIHGVAKAASETVLSSTLDEMTGPKSNRLAEWRGDA